MLCKFGLLSVSRGSIERVTESVTGVVFFLILTIFVAFKIYEEDIKNESLDNDSQDNNIQDTAIACQTNDWFSVYIFDAKTDAIRKEKRKIDIVKFPPLKYADSNTYYAIETFGESGKKIRTYYAKESWHKQIENVISEKESQVVDK